MAQSVRAKSSNEATAESLGGLGILGFFLIVFVVPTIGYIVYMLKTPWKFKMYKEYGIKIENVKTLKIISIILSLISSTLLMIVMLNESSIVSNYNLPFGNDLFTPTITILIIVSILFLTYSLIVTKKEREEIKQVKEFIIEYNKILDKKEVIMQQSVSIHNRNSDKYNSILEDEINDIMQKIQNKFDFSPTILEKIKQDTINKLKEI